MMKKKWFLYIQLLFCMSVYSQNTYYVSTTGNNSNSGSYSHPWRTIDYGIGQLYPGDTLEIMAGTYHGIVDDFARSGTEGNIITVRNYQQERVIIDGDGSHAVIYFYNKSYYHFKGLEITDGLWSGFGGVIYHHTKVSECIIHDIGPAPNNDTSVGIYISAGPGSPESSSYNVIEHNTIYNVYGEGIYLGDNAYKTPPDGSPCNYNIIRYNEIYACVDGIDVKSGSKYNQIIGNRIHNCNGSEDSAAIILFEDAEVDSNYIYDNINYGIYIQGNRNRITRNVIYDNNRYTIIITGNLDIWNNYKNAGDDNVLLNNTITDNNGYGIWIWAGDGQESQNNIVKNNIFANNTGYQFYAYPYAQSGMQMDGNNYISSSTPLIGYNNVNYNTVESFRQATGQGAHSVSLNPNFVDATNHDYHLQSTSQMIDRGLDVGLSFYGEAPDIGAFEKEIEEDNIPPNSPLNLTSPNQTSNSIELNWNTPERAGDEDYASYYKVFRNNKQVGTPSETFFIDTGLMDHTPYSYKIYSVDDNENVSNQFTEGTFQTLVSFYPKNENLFATINVGEVSKYNKAEILILITTSENVSKVPTPLILVENDLTNTYIEVLGEIPGNTFISSLLINESIADGKGYFKYNEGSLIDLDGRVGISVIEGDSIIYIDKTPPITPSNININLSNNN